MQSEYVFSYNAFVSYLLSSFIVISIRFAVVIGF